MALISEKMEKTKPSYNYLRRKQRHKKILPFQSRLCKRCYQDYLNDMKYWRIQIKKKNLNEVFEDNQERIRKVVIDKKNII